jgi:hypothetical protein
VRRTLLALPRTSADEEDDMLFMCHGTAKPGLSADDRQKVLQIFRGWTPPAAMRVEAHYVDVSGHDYVVIETDSAEALLEATGVWAPYIDYTVTPIVAAPAAVERIASAEQTRQQIL